MLLAQQQSSAEPLTQGIADRRNQPQTPGQDGCLGTSIANSHLCKRGPNPLAVRISASHFNPTVWSGKGGKMENYSRHSGQGILKGALLGTRQGYQNEDWHAGKSKADSSWSALLRVWLHELKRQPDIPSLLNHFPGLAISLYGREKMQILLDLPWHVFLSGGIGQPTGWCVFRCLVS